LIVEIIAERNYSGVSIVFQLPRIIYNILLGHSKNTGSCSSKEGLVKPLLDSSI